MVIEVPSTDEINAAIYDNYCRMLIDMAAAGMRVARGGLCWETSTVAKEQTVCDEVGQTHRISVPRCVPRLSYHVEFAKGGAA